MELGAGPGVAGLVAARVARRCYLTDYHDEVGLSFTEAVAVTGEERGAIKK